MVANTAKSGQTRWNSCKCLNKSKYMAKQQQCVEQKSSEHQIQTGNFLWWIDSNKPPGVWNQCTVELCWNLCLLARVSGLKNSVQIKRTPLLELVATSYCSLWEWKQWQYFTGIWLVWLKLEVCHWCSWEFGKTYLIKDQRKRCWRNMVVGKSIMLALHVLLCGKMSRGEMHAWEVACKWQRWRVFVLREGDSSDQRYLAGTEDARKKARFR